MTFFKERSSVTVKPNVCGDFEGYICFLFMHKCNSVTCFCATERYKVDVATLVDAFEICVGARLARMKLGKNCVKINVDVDD